MESLWSWLNTPPSTDAVLDPFGIGYLTVFTVGFLILAYLAGPGADDLARNPVQLTGIRHWSNVGLWVFGPGLVFFSIRALQINPLSFGEPIWLVASTVAVAIAGFRCIDWWRSTYPVQIAKHISALDPSKPTGANTRITDSVAGPRASQTSS